MPLSIELSDRDIPLLALTGPARRNDADCLRAKLHEAIALQKLLIVIDLFEVTSLNIDALAEIIWAVKEFRTQGGDAVITLNKNEESGPYKTIVTAGFAGWLTLCNALELDERLKAAAV